MNQENESMLDGEQQEVPGPCPRCGHLPGMGLQAKVMAWAEGGWNVSCPDCHIERHVARCPNRKEALLQWLGLGGSFDPQSM